MCLCTGALQEDSTSLVADLPVSAGQAVEAAAGSPWLCGPSGARGAGRGAHRLRHLDTRHTGESGRVYPLFSNVKYRGWFEPDV